MRGDTLPIAVGLCPDPEHTGEFYLPLDSTDSSRCPERGCSETLVVYYRLEPVCANRCERGPWLFSEGGAAVCNRPPGHDDLHRSSGGWEWATNGTAHRPAEVR